MKFKNSRWTMVMVGVIALLVVGTMVWASPPAGAPSAPLQAFDANNAHKVDGIHASRRPNALTLLALNTNKKFRASVIPAAITRDKEVMTIVKKNDGAGSGLDADLLDGHDTIYFQRVVTGTCTAGSVIRVVKADGTVTCEADDDTLGGLSCLNGQVAKWDDTTSQWACGNDESGAAGDHDHDAAYINDGAGEINASNDFNFTTSTHITNLDADKLDGYHASSFSQTGHNHDDRYYTQGELATSGGGGQVHWNNLASVPSGLDDGDDDTLGGLSCLNGQVAKWDGSAWDCGDDETGAGGDFWSLTGNAGTTPGTNFVGTTDDQALELHVNDARALRLEPHATSPNLIGGYSGNSVISGVYGATIGGGGASGNTNRVTDNYGTVGGGVGNEAGDNAGTTSDRPYATVGGGSNNTASVAYATVGGGTGNHASGKWATVDGGLNNTASVDGATVGGGRDNTASDYFTTVGGGWSNTASNGYYATVGGGLQNSAINHYATVGAGYNNTANGYGATVGGGESNEASRNYATVPGGLLNNAGGHYSFAAGRRAKAYHSGAFVWADSTDADFASTAQDQFAVRANGGATFNLGSSALHVSGNAEIIGTLTLSGMLNGGTPWTSANDGSGSGLDADLLDGQEASAFAPALHTHAGSAYANVIIVAKSGGDFTSIQAALDSITDNSASNGYLVWVAPGTYAETVTMKEYVDIEGSGELVTKITAAGSAAADTGTVVGADNAELRFLTVENTGGNTHAIAIYNSPASPRLTHVTATALGASDYNYGVFNDSSSPNMTSVTASASGGSSANYGVRNYLFSSPTMTNVTATASGATDNLAVYNLLYSSPTMTSVTATASGGTFSCGVYNRYSSVTMTNTTVIASGGTNNYGIYNESLSETHTVKVNNSRITGGTRTIDNGGADMITFVGASLLDGGHASGTICAGVYDENYAFYAGPTCP